MCGQVNALNREIILLMAGIFAGVWIGFVLTRRRYKRRISQFSNSLSNTLDQMVAQEEITFSIYQETIEDKLNLKLKRLYEILMDKTKKSQQEKENLKALVADITHQVRTPVANIKMYHSFMMERELSKEKQKEFLELTDTQIMKLEFFLDALVKMSRLESGAITLQVKEQEVKETLVQALSGIVLKAEQKQIEVMVDCPAFVTAVFDKKWTAEALFNILDNAVKYAKEGGHIWVSAAKEEFYTVIRIKDDGPGIAEAEQAQIFKRFYRSPSVHEKDGAGIGLYLTREIITKEEGYIRVKSEPQNGSEFFIYLKRE